MRKFGLTVLKIDIIRVLLQTTFLNRPDSCVLKEHFFRKFRYCSIIFLKKFDVNGLSSKNNALSFTSELGISKWAKLEFNL